MPNTLIDPRLRPLLLGAFRGFVDCFNTARCCIDLRELANQSVRLPDGVSLASAISARHALSVYETVVLLALDRIDLQLDATSESAIRSIFGPSAARFAIGVAEAAGSPSRSTIAAAAALLRKE